MSLKKVCCIMILVWFIRKPKKEHFWSFLVTISISINLLKVQKYAFAKLLTYNFVFTTKFETLGKISNLVDQEHYL